MRFKYCLKHCFWWVWWRTDARSWFMSSYYYGYFPDWWHCYFLLRISGNNYGGNCPYADRNLVLKWIWLYWMTIQPWCLPLISLFTTIPSTVDSCDVGAISGGTFAEGWLASPSICWETDEQTLTFPSCYYFVGHWNCYFVLLQAHSQLSMNLLN